MTGHDELFAHTESVLSRLSGMDPSVFGSYPRLGDAVEILRSGSRKSRHQKETLEALLEALDEDDEDDLRDALLKLSGGPNTVVLKPSVRSWLVKSNDKFGYPSWTTSSVAANSAKPGFGGTPMDGLAIRVPVTAHDDPSTKKKSKKAKPKKQVGTQPSSSAAVLRDLPAPGAPPTGAGESQVVTAVLEAAVTGTPAVDAPLGVVVDFGIPNPDDAVEEGEFSLEFPPGMNRLPMVVQLTSTDIDIDSAVGKQPLVLKRDGTSEQPATFEVTPRREGTAHLTATLLRMGSVVAQVSFAVDVAASDPNGGAVLTQLIPESSIGRALDALHIDSSRFLALTLLEINGKFRCVVSGDVAMEAELDVSPAELEAAVLQLREVLLGMSHDDAYQGSIRIEPARSERALAELAEVGALLFRALFYLKSTNTEAIAIGDLLTSRLGGEGPARPVQFVVDGYGVPWHALYLAHTLTGAPQKDRFLGLHHVIEELVVNLPRNDASIPVDEGLAVALHFDPDIDADQDISAVGKAREFWTKAVERSPGITVKDSTTNSELYVTVGPSSEYQVIYFLCHAGAGTSSEGRPLPNASWLKLTEEPVTVGELSLHADASSKLEKGPLVFVNACRSAETSAQYTVNFPNYFLDRGARTVIGTECEIATFFAEEFARRLFTAVLSGVPVGVALLDLRREMLIEEGNALGLAYGLHGASDTYLAPALLTR